MASRFKKGVSQVLTLNRVTTGFGPADASASTDGNTADDKPQLTPEWSMAQSLRSSVDKVRLKMKVAAMFKADTSKEQSSVATTDVREKEFHAVFHAKQNEKEDLLLSSEQHEENMWDIVDLDDEAIEEYASNELLGQFLSNTVFRSGILAVILLNSLLIAVETDQELERKYSHLFSVLDQCLMTIFVCEILIKWYHGFFMFWKMGWNVLDFFIVVALLLGPLYSTESGSRGVLRILRVLRAFRSLRSISSLPGLQIVVQTILQSIPDMTNIVLLLVIIMLVFSVIGITLFRDVVPRYFGTLSSAMLSLFICLTQDGWMEIFRAFKDMGETYYVAGGFYLLVFIAIGAFIFANLVVAVVVTNLEFAMDHVKSEGKEREADDLKSKTELSDDTVPAVSVEDIAPSVYHRQIPFQIPEFKSICTERLENYFLILSAIEDNLAEYKTLKEELIDIFSTVCDMQEKARKEGILKPEADTAALKGDDHMTLTGGDLMSNLIELEKGRLIDSKRYSLDMLLKEGARNVVSGSQKRSSLSERRKSSSYSKRR